MNETWVVVADSSKARFFLADGSGLVEKDVFEHPEGRMHEQELTSDLPGKAFDSGGQGRHAMGSSVEPKKHEMIKFVKSIVDHLELARAKASLAKLYLIAPSAFLGELRAQLTSPLKKIVQGEIDKNLVALKAGEIRLKLPDIL